MANYTVTKSTSNHDTAAGAVAGLETLLEAVATTLTVRSCDIIRLHEHSYLAYVVVSDATV